MLAAAFEFLVWSLIGLALGFAGHFAKAHFDASPDVPDEDRALFDLGPAQYGASARVEGGDYTEAGHWDYYSWANLRWYLGGGLGTVLAGVYTTADGHSAARDMLCGGARVFGLVPVFCS